MADTPMADPDLAARASLHSRVSTVSRHAKATRSKSRAVLASFDSSAHVCSAMCKQHATPAMGRSRAPPPPLPAPRGMNAVHMHPPVAENHLQAVRLPVPVSQSTHRRERFPVTYARNPSFRPIDLTSDSTGEVTSHISTITRDSASPIPSPPHPPPPPLPSRGMADAYMYTPISHRKAVQGQSVPVAVPPSHPMLRHGSITIAGTPSHTLKQPFTTHRHRWVSPVIAPEQRLRPLRVSRR